MGLLDGVGGLFNQLGTDVHNALGGMQPPSQPATPKNAPLPSPAINPARQSQPYSPLASMKPPAGGGAGFSASPSLGNYAGPRQMQARQAMPPAPGTQDITPQLQQAASAIGSLFPAVTPKQSLQTQTALSVPSVSKFTGAGQFAENTGVTQLVKDSANKLANVANAGIVDPMHIIQKPEFWFSEDAQGANTNIGQNLGLSGGPGHNYLKDVLNPIYHQITGQDVPHTSLYYQRQAQDLNDQANKLQQVQQQINANPNATAQDIAAWNAAHSALLQKYQQFQTESAASQDFWANSNFSKVLSLAGQAATAPLGFAVGSLQFFGGILTNPVASVDSIGSMIQDAATFGGMLMDQQKRDHMSSAELTAHIMNLVTLGVLAFGAKNMVAEEVVGPSVMPGKLDLAEPDLAGKIQALRNMTPEEVRAQMPSIVEANVRNLQEQSPSFKEANNPAGAPHPDPQARIAELENSLTEVQFQRARSNSPTEKTAMSQQMHVIRDEINQLKQQPKATERIANQAQQEAQGYPAEAEWAQTQKDLGLNMGPDMTEGEALGALYGEKNVIPQATSRYVPPARLPDIAANLQESLGPQGYQAGAQAPVQRPGEPGESTVQRAVDRYNQNQNVAQDLTRERQTEQRPQYTKPLIASPNVYLDSPADVLGKTFEELRPTPQDRISMNLQPVRTANFETMPTRNLKALIETTRDYLPAKISELGPNAWVHPDGNWGIPLISRDEAAHSDFFDAIRQPGDNREAPQVASDLMDAGWIKKSTISGMVNFGVHGLDAKKIDTINQLIRTDMKHGISPYPYQVADELSGRPAYEITPKDFAAYGFDIAPIIDRIQRYPQLNVRPAESPVGTIEITPELVDKALKIASTRETIDGEILGARKTPGWTPRPMADVTYGFLLPDRRGLQLPPGQEHANFIATLVRALGKTGEDVPTWDAVENGLIEVRSIYGDSGRKLLYLDGPEFLSGNQTKLIEDYLLGRDQAGVAPEQFSVNDKLFNFADFKNNNYSLEGLRPQKALGALQIGTAKTLPPGANRQASTTGKTGQTSQEYNPAQTGAVPQGVPEGSTFASTIQRGEGEAPIAVWKTITQSARALSGDLGQRGLDQAKQNFVEAVNKAVDMTQIEQVLGSKAADDLKRQMLEDYVGKYTIEGYNKFVYNRTESMLKTFNKHIDRIDPEGLVQHIVFDDAHPFDGSYTAGADLFTFNPAKMVLVEHVNALGRGMMAMAEYLQDSLGADQYKELTQFIQKWTSATQEDLDLMGITEETGHAYDVDHMTPEEYIQSVQQSSQAWLEHAARSGFADDPTGNNDWTHSAFGAMAKILNRAADAPKRDGLLNLFHDLTEFRANQFKNYMGDPLSGYSFRVPGAWINEIKDPSLIKQGGQVFGQEFENTIRPRVRAYVASRANVPRPATGPTAVAFERGTGAATRPAHKGTGTAFAYGEPPAGSYGIADAGATATSVSAADTAGLAERNARDQGSLTLAVKAADPSLELGKRVVIDALAAIARRGYTGRWEDFAKAVNMPEDSAEYKAVQSVFEALPERLQKVFKTAGQSEVATRPPVPEPTAPASPQVVQSQAFLEDQAKIKAAQAQLAIMGRKINQLRSAGASAQEITDHKASMADLQAYVQARLDGKPDNEAIRIGKQAYQQFVVQAETPPTGAVVPDVEELGKIVKGRQYAAVSVDMAKLISKRLQLQGYESPENLKGFFDGLFGQDPVSEKAFKQLGPTTQQYIKDTLGYPGPGKRGKPLQVAKPQLPTGVNRDSTPINPVDSKGLQSTVQAVPDGIDIVRHGETGLNAAGKIRSDTDVPLNDNGVQQAKNIAAAYQGVKVNKIITSDLERAHDTALAIAGVTNAEVVVDPNLQPWKLGNLRGTSATAAVPVLKDYIHNRPDEPVPGGESFNQFRTRYLNALAQHMDAHDPSKGKIVIVAHTRNLRTAKDWINAGMDVNRMDFKALDTPEEVSPGGVMTLTKDGQIVGEASQAKPGDKIGTVGTGATPAPEPLQRDTAKVQENVKAIDSARTKTAAVKGEIPLKVDLPLELDAIAADVTHPLNIAAAKVKMLRDMIPSAQRLGGAATQRIMEDYANAVADFTEKYKALEQDAAKATDSLQPPMVKDQKVFDHTYAIARDLQKKIDKGVDPVLVAAEAAKKLGKTLDEAKVSLKQLQDGFFSDAHSWAPAYKDLFYGKAGKFVRKERLSDPPSKTVLPGVTREEMLGADLKDVKPPRSNTKGAVSRSARPAPVARENPAITNTLKESTPSTKGATPHNAQQVHNDTKKQVAGEGKKGKTTKQLRDETTQIHEKLNTPAPNPFAGDPEGTDGGGNNRAGTGGAGGRGGTTPPGINLLDGWDDARDNTRDLGGDLEEAALREDTFLKEFAMRTDAGRRYQDPIEQHKALHAAEQADLLRSDNLAKLYDKILGSDLDVHDKISAAMEGTDEQMAEARKQLTAEEAAVADLLGARYKVMGRILQSANRDIIKDAVEHYLPHQLKFNDEGKATMKGNGTPNAFTNKMKSYLRRKVDPVTGESKFPTTADLVAEFGADHVERNIVTRYRGHAEAMIHAARVKEMIDDFSGAYIKDDHFVNSAAMFEELSRTPGIGGRGLKKGDLPYVGRVVVPVKDLEAMAPEYRRQLTSINIGFGKNPLRDFMVYKPLAEHLERYASPTEGASLADKAINAVGKSNTIYKAYKFAYNPVHWFNVVSDVVAMLGKEGWSPSLYGKIWGRVNRYLQADMTNPKADEIWHTPAGDFTGDEVVNQVVKHGGTPPRKTTEASGIGLGGRWMEKYIPGMKFFAQKMWTDTVWKAHVGLAVHLTDVAVAKYTKETGAPPNEAVWHNIFDTATQNASYAVGYINKADMSRNFDMLSNAAAFASKWTVTQFRMSGRVLPQNVPGAKFLSNIGGGERYTTVLSDQMRSMGGMTQKDLDFINGMSGKLARQLMLSGSVKLLATSTLMAMVGSYIATGSAVGPWQNFQRDPTHTFDIYTGIDPKTGKDTWEHNPLFGMQQEMLLYMLAAVRAWKNGGNPYDIAIAGPARMLNKANPILATGLDVATNREISLAILGYGPSSYISPENGKGGDKTVAAIRLALDAKGVPDLGGLEDRIIYAIRNIVPSPGFPTNTGKGSTISSWGDIANSLGPGKWLGFGDAINAWQTGQHQGLVPQDLGNLAQFALGTRPVTSLTPQTVAQDNLLAQSIAQKQTKDQAALNLLNAVKTGNFKQAAQIASSPGFDNSQLISALFYPPSGSGGGIQYQGESYAPTAAAGPQDTLLNTELSVSQTAHFEALKKANTEAIVTALEHDPTWLAADGTTRLSMFNAYRTLTEAAVSDQYAQSQGLLGGTPITTPQIGELLAAAMNMRQQVMTTLKSDPTYIQSDAITRKAMETNYDTYAMTLAHDAVLGKLSNVPPQQIQQIITQTIQVEDQTRNYLKQSAFYQTATVADQTRMVAEYTTLARTIAMRGALGQGQGSRNNEYIPPSQMAPLIANIINSEEYAKSYLHAQSYYVNADITTQNTLDTKYETLARSLAFSTSPEANPVSIITNSLRAESAYYGLQDQYGGSDYIKLMAQQLSDLQANVRQSADYTPKQIAALEKVIRTNFLAQNPAYGNYLAARTYWEKNTDIGQIYLALSNSEYAAVNDLAGASVPAADSYILSGGSLDPTTPTSDPTQLMGLPSVDLSNASLTATGQTPNPASP